MTVCLLPSFGGPGLFGFFGELEQSTDTACDCILGDLRFGNLAELLEALVHVVDAQLA